MNMKTFFFFLFFWRSPDFGQKNALNFGEDLFFWRSPDFGLKNVSISCKIDDDLSQVRSLLFETSKKAPPFCEILATRPV